MIRDHIDGILLYRFAGLRDVPGLVHGVLTRVGGVSQPPFATLNLCLKDGEDPAAVFENLRRASRALGLEAGAFVRAWQVHGAHVDVVGWADRGTVHPDTDGLATAVPGVPLLMCFGDCTPVLFFDPVRRAIGVAHAGWRGVVAGAVPSTVGAMVEHLGCNPADLWAGIGPTIGPCCYEVGPEVVSAVRAACPPGSDLVRRVDGRTHLDLAGAVRVQLRACGVGQIEEANLCTACHVDEFFSHRAENGHTGRFGVMMGLNT